MQEFDKHKISITEVLFLAGLTGLYFITRLRGLQLFPIFTDEAMYIHIAQIINENRENLFLTKINALKPLFIWMIAVYQDYITDPILAGRLVSVTAGMVSILGIYFLARELFSKRVGKVSAIIYLFCPYFIFYERLALMESLVNAFGIWIVWVSFRIAKENEVKKGKFILLGSLLGLAFFTKSTALIFFPAPVIIFIMWKTYNKQNFFKYISWTVLLILLINLPYFLTDQTIGFQKRHPIFSGTTYYISFEKILQFPLDIWWNNISSLYVNLMIYLTFPIFLLTTFGFIFILTTRNKTGATLFLLFLIPVLIIILIGKIIFSRYYLVTIPPLIILSGWALVNLASSISEKRNILGSNQKQMLIFIFILLINFEGMAFAINISKDPFKAFFPNFDRFQYLISPLSGHGIKQAAEFLILKSREEPINVMTSWSQGNPQDGIMIYLWKKPDINIIPALWWPVQKQLLPKGKSFPIYKSKYQREISGTGNASNLKKVFFIMPFNALGHEKEIMDNNPEWELAWSYPTLDGKNHLQIYSLVD